MSKRPNLADIAAAAGSIRRQSQPASPPLVPIVHERDGRDALSPKAKARLGMKQVAGHFPEEVAWQLRELAVEQRVTVQELLGEALNDLFQKHGKPELLPGRRSDLS